MREGPSGAGSGDSAGSLSGVREPVFPLDARLFENAGKRHERASVTEAGQAHPSHGLSVLCCARAWRRASMTPVVEAATATCSHRHDDRASARASRRTWTATTSAMRLELPDEPLPLKALRPAGLATSTATTRCACSTELPDEPLPLEGPSSRSSVTEAGQAHPFDDARRPAR